MQQTFVLHTQNSATFVLRTQKSTPKSRPKNLAKRQQKSGKKGGKKVGKKHAIKAQCHIYNTLANDQTEKKLLRAYS